MNEFTHINLNSFYGIVKALAECKAVDRMTKVNDKWVRGMGRSEDNGFFDMAGDDNGRIFYPDYVTLTGKHFQKPIQEQIKTDITTQIPNEARRILRVMRDLINDMMCTDVTCAEDQEHALYYHLNNTPYDGDWILLYNELTRDGEYDTMELADLDDLYPETSALAGTWFDPDEDKYLVPLTPKHYMGENPLEGELMYGQYTWSHHLPGARSILIWYITGDMGDFVYKSMPIWFTANR